MTKTFDQPGHVLILILAAAASIIPFLILARELTSLIGTIDRTHAELGLNEVIRINSIKWSLTNVAGSLVGLGFVLAAAIFEIVFGKRSSLALALALILIGEATSIGTVYLSLEHFGLYRGG